MADAAGLIGAAAAVAVPSVLAVVWFVRLEGRVNGHDKQIDGIEDDIKYVRSRIDRALNGHK